MGNVSDARLSNNAYTVKREKGGRMMLRLLVKIAITIFVLIATLQSAL